MDTTVISSYGYSVNSLGQRSNVAQAGSAFAATRTIVWGYDPYGQVITAESLTLPTSNNYTPNVLNQYTSLTVGTSGPLVPGYDFDGNMTSGPLPANQTANSTLAWDAENRLISTTVNSVTTTYLYDSQSRRIAQTTGTATTLYVYDGWNSIAEYSASTLSKTYTWGMDLSGSMQGAGGVGGLLAVTDSTGSCFPTFDGNGNISEYLDATGAIAAHYEYDPFGRETVSNGTNPTGFAHRFSTKPLDTATGLYYYGYRYYDPGTGRWPSRDPIEERGGINLYSFVVNDGVNWLDDLGLQTKGPDGRDRIFPPIPRDPLRKDDPKPPGGPPGEDPDLKLDPPIIGPRPGDQYGYYFAVARAYVKLTVDEECFKKCKSDDTSDDYIDWIKSYDNTIIEHIEFYREGPRYAPWPFGPIQNIDAKKQTEAEAGIKAMMELKDQLDSSKIVIPHCVIYGELDNFKYEILFPAEFRPAPYPVA